MPFSLNDRDISADISNVRSALIVPCRFCPAASLAVREKKPFIELFRTFLRTAAYESYIKKWRSRLEQAGIKAEVFDSRMPHHFVLCMWTAGRRQDLKARAAGFDAVIVLGCDAAVKTAEGSIGSAGCKIVQGMEVDGIMNVIPSFHFPFTISLEVTSVTRVLEHRSEEMARKA